MPDIGYWTRTNLDSLSPVANQVVGFQTTTITSRTAGLYTYTGSWMLTGRDFNGQAIWMTNTVAAGVLYTATDSRWQGRHILYGHDPGTHGGYGYSVMNLVSEPTGSGSNGPISADAGMYISTLKKNWQTSSVDGEVEGMFIVCRQGSRGDVGGILIDVAAYGMGNNNVLEAIETGFTHQNSVGTVLAAINAQVAGAKPGSGIGGRWTGFEAIALSGTQFDGTQETYGYLVSNLDNSTTWNSAFASVGRSTYGLNLAVASISFASIATPNDIPMKQMDSTATLRNTINLNGTDNLSIGDSGGGMNDVILWPPARIKKSIHQEVTAVRSNIALDGNHNTLAVETGSLGVTLTLPDATGVVSRIYHTIKIDSYSTPMRIQPSAGNLLNGFNNFIDHITQWDALRIQSVASGYWVSNIMNAG